jgi:hypothetical protein
MKRVGAIALVSSALLASACPAQAADLLRKDVTVPTAVERTCAAGKLSGGVREARRAPDDRPDQGVQDQALSGSTASLAGVLNGTDESHAANRRPLKGST